MLLAREEPSSTGQILAQGRKAHVAALDERAEDGAANVAPT
jgi:hypothetical protein